MYEYSWKQKLRAVVRCEILVPLWLHLHNMTSLFIVPLCDYSHGSGARCTVDG